MIESILIKKVASYNVLGTKLEKLKKINFIYGANGSGKTTISNLIQDPLNEMYGDCEVQWKHDQQIKTLIYNKNFRNKNLGKGAIDGVFTLGQATKEELKTINEKEEALKEIQKEGIQKKESLEKRLEEKAKEEERFKEDSWKNIYKKYENPFGEAFKGFMNKDLFRNKLLNEAANNTPALATIEQLKQRAKTIFGTAPLRLPNLTMPSHSKIAEIEENGIWAKKVIGKTDIDIAALIQALNMNDWVNQGRGYIQESSTCPFCQESTITDEFRSKLESYYDESFTNDTKDIESLAKSYNELGQNIVHELEGIETKEKEKEESKLSVDMFSALIKTFASQFSNNKTNLQKKNKEPSRSIDLVFTKVQLAAIGKLIDEAEVEIKKHNDIVDNYSDERIDLIKSVWKCVVEEFKSDIQGYVKKMDGLQKGVENINKDYQEKRQEYSTMKLEIEELTKNVTSIQPTVNEINNTLKFYGFSNFEITPSEKTKNSYEIQREDGTLAESTLSEGEITFITFLYFHQLVKGSTKKENISEERILIIDDPVSSLDSNVLFVVSTLIKDIMKGIKGDVGNVKQLMLLTHNVYFHKEVSFILGKNQKNADTFYWILRKKDKHSIAQCYGMDNPIHTSYELLWKELKEKDRNSGITIQNTMRRIIETYFKILGNYGDDDLIGKFDNNEEQQICKSLISWVNDGSHGVSDDLYIEAQDDSIDKYFSVFKEVFSKTKHEAHYEMMMGKVSE